MPAIPGSTAAATPAAEAPSKTLLVDDDESDNNNIPGDKRLSVSDTFFRTMLKRQGLAFDTTLVPRYQSGPGIAALRPYTLVIWYTGASYGGNPDHTATLSLDDEKTVQQYLGETGGTLILVSPGYMINALGAGDHWGDAEGEFLGKVMGVRGGRGLLKRFEAGQVTNAAGTAFTVNRNPDLETQFSALNPETAATLFTAPLDPDGQGPKPTPVAVSQRVGAGRLIYIGFTLENVAPDGAAAFASVLQAAAVTPARSTAAANAMPAPRRVRSEALSVSGIASRGVHTEALSVTGIANRSVRTEALAVTGIATRNVRTEALSVTGAPPTR